MGNPCPSPSRRTSPRFNHTRLVFDRFLRHEAGPRCPCRWIRNRRWHRLLEGEEFVGKLLGRAGLRQTPARQGWCGRMWSPRWTTIVSRRFRVSFSSFSSSKPSTTCTTFAHSLVVLLLVLGLGKKRRGLSFQHAGPRFVTAGGNVACLSSCVVPLWMKR